MKVLLVDDHPLILAALQSVIRGLGDDVTVVGVSTEKEARAALKRDPDYDLVLLDLQLGASDGFELLADLRKTYPALPIVVVSASDRASDVIRATSSPVIAETLAGISWSRSSVRRAVTTISPIWPSASAAACSLAIASADWA